MVKKAIVLLLVCCFSCCFLLAGCGGEEAAVLTQDKIEALITETESAGGDKLELLSLEEFAGTIYWRRTKCFRLCL